MNLQENTFFDLDLGAKVTQKIAQFPLHHVIYASTKFVVATSYRLGEDTITRKVTDGRMYRRKDDGPTLVRNNIPYFFQQKAGIITHLLKSFTLVSACFRICPLCHEEDIFSIQEGISETKDYCACGTFNGMK